MLTAHDRAFKEWAVVCEALKTGRQTILIRKGGIREEDGIFRVDDSEFVLLPTYEHQDPRLLKPEFAGEISTTAPHTASIDTYAVLEHVAVVNDEEKLGRF